MRALDLQRELNSIGVTFAPMGYIKAPAYPYGIYVDDISVRQPDEASSKRIETHTVTIELYHDDLETLQSLKVVDDWLNSLSLDYGRVIRYVIDEAHFCATYSFSYTTKERVK